MSIPCLASRRTALSAFRRTHRNPGMRLVESCFVPAPPALVFELLDRQDRFPQWHRQTSGVWGRLKEPRLSRWGDYVPAGARVSGDAPLQIYRRPGTEVRVKQIIRRRIGWELAFRLTPSPGGCRLLCSMEYRPLGRFDRIRSGSSLERDTAASLQGSLEFIRRLAASFERMRPSGSAIRPPELGIPDRVSEPASRAG